MLFALILAAASPAKFEMRCGWLHNPTPANYWLTDRDGQWTLMTQGGAVLTGWEELQPSEPPEWVRTNGYYGHGCACARVRTDRRKREVLEIASLTYRPLAVCRADRRLPKP